ncbi:efflux RND transporter permease subunit [Alteromonas sp. P256]|uniref:efflux RND transporter permease subunit n=1 Tax=Alteromonas sp. P256 TaxID=3117399 RepID=UPI002FE16351
MSHKSKKPFYLAFPKASLVFTLLVMALALIGAQNLYFRGDYKVFFEESDPQRMAFEEMQNVFNKTENVAFMIVPKSNDVFNQDTLNLAYDITEAAWQLPLSTRVESITNYQHTYDLDGDLIVEDLLFEKLQNSEEVAQIEKVVDSTPEILGRLVSKNKEALVVDTTIQLPEGDQTKAVIEIATAAKAIKAEMLERYPGHEIYLTGMVIMNDAFAVAAQSDAETLIPAMFLLIFVSIAIIVRSVWSAVFTMAVVIASIAITVGLTGWVGIYLSTATVNAPTMITTLAVADCIHIIVGVKYFLSKGFSAHNAIEQSVKVNKKPIFITSVTTAIGFLMLNFSAVPVLAHLGNMTALGVMLACVFSLTVLPSMLVLKPLSSGSAINNTLFVRWGAFVVKNHKVLLVFSLSTIVIISAFAMNNRLNDVAVKYFDERSTFRQAVDVNEKIFGGMSNIDFVLYTDTPYGITKNDFLSDVALFSEWLTKREEVNHVLTFTDTLKRLNKNMNGDDEAFHVIPGDSELASQYLLLYEMSLPFGLDLGNQLDIDKSALRVIAVIENLGSNEITQLEKDAKDFFNSLDNKYRIEAASPPLMFAHIGERNMKNMVWGSVLALALISGLILFALKSIKLGAASLVTNLLPAAIGFGVWGMVSGEINMALSVVISMTMGIIVDDTVHFLSKYQTARKENKSAHESVIFAFSSVGMALTTTTIVLTLGFAVLASSSFMLNAHMGILTIIIIVAALIVDFIFLPALLAWIGDDRQPKRESYT